MAGLSRRTYLRDVNPHLICPLCKGYLIDAITVVECLHSFCRSCILKHLNGESNCPSCKHVLNKAKPNIKADKALQDIVYKLVPGLYHKEMRRRREFYKKHPEHASKASPEQRGEDVSGRLIFAPEDAVSLSMEYLPPGADPLTATRTATTTTPTTGDRGRAEAPNRRYLQCPALVTIAHLKKFLGLKYGVDMTRYNIEICHRRAPLPEHWTLMDCAYIYAWKRNAPMRFFYRIAQEEHELEAPLHARPSTPGLGASLPPNPADGSRDYGEPTDGPDRDPSTDAESVATPTLPAEAPKEASVPSNPDGSSESPTSEKKPEVETDPTVVKVEAVARAPDQSPKQTKSPIKILKNPDGRYEVLRNPLAVRNRDDRCEPTLESKPVGTPQFSVVGIGDGQNSTSVRITLKQRSPGSTASKKPTVISNVLLRCGQTEKPSEKPDGTRAELLVNAAKRVNEEMADGPGKQKHRVAFTDPPNLAKPETEGKTPNKYTDRPDKNQFLQSFQLTAKESSGSQSSFLPSSSSGAAPKVTSNIGSTEREDSKSTAKPSDTASNTSSNTPSNTSSNKPSNTSSNIPSNTSSTSPSNTSSNTPSRPVAKLNEVVTGSIINEKGAKLDVYAFPNEPSFVPPGAVKRKCPPGLPIFNAKRQKRVKPATPQVAEHLSPKSHRKPSAPPPSPTDHDAHPERPAAPTGPKYTPRLPDDTRNLLDECGLNIPASLSITLTAPKSPAGGATASTDTTISKDSEAFGKVNPSITLNDRSVDPRILKALKSGQIRMPAPKTPAPKQRPPQPPKRPKDHAGLRDILDLSGGTKGEVHPLRIPQPVPKHRGKGAGRERSPAQATGQVVTLVGGQRYYRAPPGALTPAVHRDVECPLAPASRAPVYAPSCVSSSGNLSSEFPSLQSLYALSQSPSLQQLHLDSRIRLNNRTDRSDAGCSASPSKSHLAAQCAPVKPARSSVAPLAVAVSRQPTPRPGPPPSGSDSEHPQGSASPRVSSTVSPPPSGPEVTSTRAPDSPDSSSTLPERRAGKVAGPADEGADRSSSSTEPTSKVERKPGQEPEQKVVKCPADGKVEQSASKMTSEILQKRLLAAFPSNEWANNPIAAEHLGNFLKSLTSVQSDGRNGTATDEPA
ncbi:polycomb group protein Psc [Orussus abietinus]|uniref:polycomb group protein Psc n=1 Tax=Orussus abietinus TaxID=222816 RepID=UPI000626842A|nr:polycomb group protein Psc [Orussus abietinus]